MIKIERLERFISLHDTKDRTDPEDDLYYDLMKQLVFDLACELWQDESAAGVFVASSAHQTGTGSHSRR